MGKRIAVALIVCGMVMATPSRSLAKGEITGVIGGLIGGDLNNVLSGNISVGGAFENGPLYGVRLGWIIPLIPRPLPRFLPRFVPWEGAMLFGNCHRNLRGSTANPILPVEWTPCCTTTFRKPLGARRSFASTAWRPRT